MKCGTIFEQKNKQVRKFVNLYFKKVRMYMGKGNRVFPKKKQFRNHGVLITSERQVLPDFY